MMENRHCPFCGSIQIEDEVHLLFCCPIYPTIRNNFYNKIKTAVIPNTTQLPDCKRFDQLAGELL